MFLRDARFLLCLCVAALVSCSDQRSPPDGVSPGDGTVEVADDAVRETGAGVQPTAVAPVVPVADEPTGGGADSQIKLQPLSAARLDGVDVPGELACTFADADGAMLLLARADVVPDGAVRGVVNNNEVVETLGNGQAGGFNDLSDGITLTGKGLVVELERGASRPTGNETTEHVATLKVQLADGAERSYDGILTCGP